MRPTELPRTFALKYNVKTSRSGNGSHSKEGGGALYISSVSRSTNAQTKKSGSRGGEQHSNEVSSSVLPRGSVLHQSGTKLAVMATRSVAVQTEDLICGALSCGTGSRLRQSLPQPPTRWMLGARCTNDAPPRSSIGELQKMQLNIQYALNKREGLWAFVGLPLSLSDSHVGTDAGGACTASLGWPR